MSHLSRNDLMSLEDYNEARNDFRRRVMQHKKNRVIPLGPNMTLHFEDELIMQYQIQEMLRAEKIFDAAGIQEELDTYNALIPDGDNWKATMMIEFDDPKERAEALKKLIDVEDKVWMCVEGFDKVYAIADEDIERATAEKTSSVHFLRFQLNSEMVAAAQNQAKLSLGVDHPAYSHQLDPLADHYQQALIKDLAD